MKWLLMAFALALGTSALPAPSWAMGIDYSVSCLKQTELKSYLSRAFNETPIAVGALENGNRIEIYAARSGSWTMVELPGNGYGCIHSYGHGLRVERGSDHKRSDS